MSGDSGLGSKLLKKMGWTEGTAIGKSGTGIVVPIKPKLKVGTAGIGFRESEHLYSGWWMEAFNKAAAASGSGANAPSSQPAEAHGDDVDDDEEDKQQLQQSSLSSSPGKRRRRQQQQQQLDSQPVSLPVLGRPYAAFSASNGGAAATVLRNGREETVERQSAVGAEADDKARQSASVGLPQAPSDEDLLAACGGRTAHAAARFGLSLGGKLARVRAQDLRLTAAEPADRERKERKLKRRRSERAEDSQANA